MEVFIGIFIYLSVGLGVALWLWDDGGKKKEDAGPAIIAGLLWPLLIIAAPVKALLGWLA